MTALDAIIDLCNAQGWSLAERWVNADNTLAIARVVGDHDAALMIDRYVAATPRFAAWFEAEYVARRPGAHDLKRAYIQKLAYELLKPAWEEMEQSLAEGLIELELNRPVVSLL